MALTNYKVGTVTAVGTTLVTPAAGTRFLVTSTRLFNGGTVDATVEILNGGVQMFKDVILPGKSIFIDGQSDVVVTGESFIVKSTDANVSAIINGDLA